MTFNPSDGWDDRGLESGIGKAASAFALLLIIGRKKLAIIIIENKIIFVINNYRVKWSVPRCMWEFVQQFPGCRNLNLMPGVLETLYFYFSHRCCYSHLYEY